MTGQWKQKPENFFHHQGVGQIAHIGAAIFFADGNAKDTKVAKFFPHLYRSESVV